MKNLIRFLFSKVFIVNLLIFTVVTTIVVFILLGVLDSYTHHGEKITVRPLIGRTLEEVDELLSNNKLQYIVGDSSYSSEYPAGVVLAQNPKAGAQVKENRTIYLTINKVDAPMVSMPKLTDVSLRQAQDLLTSKGLLLGKIEYRASPYHMEKDENYVLQQLIKGDTIATGSMVKKGSRVDLIVSSGLDMGSNEVPYLIGSTFDEVMQILPILGFNVGIKSYDNTVGEFEEDTVNAKVVRQIPMPGEMHKLGAPIELFFSKELPESLQIDPSDAELIEEP